MTGFTESALVKKLNELNNSSQSIQTLSLWIIHHRKHHSQVVKIWLKELIKATSRKLVFMYLANDVIQNSRKKGPEYGKEFGLHLKKAFEHMASAGDEKTKASLGRLLNIWKERGMYEENQIVEFQAALAAPATAAPAEEPPSKKQKSTHNNSTKEKKKPDIEVQVEVDGKVETHVHLSPRTNSIDPPEPEDLIKAIQELENNTASTDEVIRQRIAQLPVEVSEISHLSKLEDKDSAEILSKKVEDALVLINDYNNRLTVEVENRKKVSTMLKDFLTAQKELLAQAESGLEDYQEKLSKVYTVRQELKSHIQNLPDLTALPDVTGGLAPLPSAGDLFNVNNVH